MCQGSGPKSGQVLASWESQAGVVSSVYKEWRVMRDPRWCDGRSNVNGVRHLHSFGSQPNLVKLVVAAKCQRSRTGHPHHPPLCHPPPPCFTYPAIAALAAPQGIPGEGRANARIPGWAQAGAALQMGWRPPPTRISIG